MDPQPLTPERLFERYFLPLYPEDALRDLPRARSTDANPAKIPPLSGRWPRLARPSSRCPPRRSRAGFRARLDRRLGAQARRRADTRATRRVGGRARAPDGTPLLAQVVVHGSLDVGGCAVRQHEAAWQVRRPLWESQVRVTSPVGEANLALFHWWLKSLVRCRNRFGTPWPIVTARTWSFPGST